MANTESMALVAGLRACDSNALGDAYKLYADRVYSFAVRLTGRRDVADELFQHAWLTLAERGPRLDPDTNLLPWLLTVARNHWRTRHRRRATHHKHEQIVAETVVPPPPPDVSAERRAMLARLDKALMALDEQHREVLVLVIEGEDMPQQELARVLGLSHPAFRKRLSRARQALARLLDLLEDP